MPLAMNTAIQRNRIATKARDTPLTLVKKTYSLVKGAVIQGTIKKPIGQIPSLFNWHPTYFNLG